MRVLYFAGIQALLWVAFNTLSGMLKDERMLVAVFVATAVVTMVTTAILLKKD